MTQADLVIATARMAAQAGATSVSYELPAEVCAEVYSRLAYQLSGGGDENAGTQWTWRQWSGELDDGGIWITLSTPRVSVTAAEEVR